MLVLLPLLLACSSDPTVQVHTGRHPDGALPAKLAEVLDREIRRPIERCYLEALQEDDSLSGEVAYSVSGSHGILKATDPTGSGPLQACALAPMEDSRLMRTLGDGDQTVAFTLRVVFTR